MPGKSKIGPVEDSAISQLQRRMLGAGKFYLDGWTRPEVHEAAADLERRGLVIRQSSQYTRDYCVTEAGRLLVG
jgi:hypothetical protein